MRILPSQIKNTVLTRDQDKKTPKKQKWDQDTKMLGDNKTGHRHKVAAPPSSMEEREEEKEEEERFIQS